jgi:hypothetical protein
MRNARQQELERIIAAIARKRGMSLLISVTESPIHSEGLVVMLDGGDGERPDWESLRELVSEIEALGNVDRVHLNIATKQ